ncbi:MAG: cytochrome c family protein [Alphaproteobacteria bacterium]|nr:cytochrome c family protein [Alphaproteobacteria bacterium]MDE2109807.1 cytochrome c family protein [Alphaproteobacteria bacterium]MDE2495694.1 cytochrome c family protein [Alphaproteobacteria bacterium]
MARSLIPAAGLGFAFLAATALAFIPATPASAAVVMMTSPPKAITGDVAAGAKVFQRCAMCHTDQQGAANRIGPNLFDVVGRKAASLPNFSYSSALKGSGITWTDDKLKEWVSGPQKVVPGTRMTFPGLSDQKQVDDLIAYLNSKK